MRPRGIKPLTDRDWQRIGVKCSNNHPWETVVLESNTLEVWLDRSEEDSEVLGSILCPARRGTLIAHPVDLRVGKVREDDAGLLQEVSLEDEPLPAEPLTLF